MSGFKKMIDPGTVLLRLVEVDLNRDSCKALLGHDPYLNLSDELILNGKILIVHKGRGALWDENPTLKHLLSFKQ